MPEAEVYEVSSNDASMTEARGILRLQIAPRRKELNWARGNPSKEVQTQYEYVHCCRSVLKIFSMRGAARHAGATQLGFYLTVARKRDRTRRPKLEIMRGTNRGGR